MADNKSVFQPVTAETFSGPFQGFLTPPQPTPVEKQAQQMPGPANLGGGLAMVATAFLQGAAQGRIKKYEQEQNERFGKLQTLNSYMIQIANDPDLTPEAKQLATQQYYRAIGGDLMDATKDSGKNKDGDSSHPGHHFGAVMKDLAVGLTGGKKPKGMPDPSNAIAQIHSQLYGADGKVKPEYSSQARQADFAKQAEAIYAKYPPGTPPETVAGDQQLSTLKAQWQRQDPQGARTYFESREAAFPQAPSVAAEEREISQIGQKPAATSGPPSIPSSKPAPGTSEFLTQGLGTPGPPEAPTAGGFSGGIPGQALTGLQLTGRQFETLQRRPGRVSKEDDFDLDGKRVTGHIVQLDSGPAFFDMNNRQMDIDLSKLKPWKGVQRVNIVDPANPYTGISAVRNLNTGMLYDENGIALPPAQQKWQESAALVRPPTQQQRPSYVDSSGHPVFRQPDGTFKTLTDTIYDKPDKFAMHYNLQMQGQEARDTRTLVRSMTTQRNQNLIRINLQADRELSGIDANVLVKDKAKAKAEIEARRKASLAEEEKMYQAGLLAFDELETPSAGDGKPKPSGRSKQSPAAPPPGPNKLSDKAKSLF